MTSNLRATWEKEFAQHFDGLPEVIAQAPGRVNLIGEHIDYNDGYVLPFAIESVTTAAMSRRDDDLINLVSMQMPDAKVTIDLAALNRKEGDGWARYVLGTIWSLGVNIGLDILIDGKVPLGAGLSSSAALECSVATALNQLCGLNKSKVELARLTQRAENDYVGMPCGIMDQSVSLMARKGHALLLDCIDLSTEQIPVDFEGSGLRLLIIDTRAHHALIDGGYAERRASCERAREILKISNFRDLTLADLEASRDRVDDLTFKRVRHVVTEIGRVQESVSCLRSGEFGRFGVLLSASHTSLRDDYTVSCPELDLAVDTALSHGALGARMVGGGFGGSAIALIRSEDREKVSMAISDEFKRKGFEMPRFFESLPSDGARILN